MAVDIEKVLGKTSAPKREDIAALLFKARTDVHLTHLKQADKTYARHNALQIFYDEILDAIDTYVETSMGIDDSFVLDKVPASETIANPILYFKNLYNEIQRLRTPIKESFLQNQIDEISQLIAHTMYRLKNITT